MTNLFNLSEIDRGEREKRSSELLKNILRIVISILTLYLITREIAEPELFLSDIILYSITGSLIVSYFILRKKHFYLASVISILVTFGGMTFIAFTNSGVRDIGVMTYFILIVFSALLLGWVASVVITVFSICAIIGMTVYENLGLLVYQNHPVTFLARDLSFFLTATLVLTIFYDMVLNRYIREINQSKKQYLDLYEELTERNQDVMKINDELLLAKEKAEESDRLKTAFLANLSHEIRTPMNGIIGFSELVISSEATSEEKKEYKSIIENSCKQLLGVVNDIIDISKIESGIIEIKKKKVNLNALMQEIHSFNSLSAKNNGIQFELFTGLDDEKSDILTDDIKLRQVLSNLVGNALKFTSNGSIRFGYRVKDRFLEFFVSDTGIGISPGKLKVIFERFIQEDDTITRKYGGTGLGLSIAKAYVEKLGGEIWVKSEENAGSKFFFTIPIESPDLKADSYNIISFPANSGKLKVLLVEDIQINVVLLKEFLKKYDIEIIEAHTGEEAIRIFEKSSDLGLIFMDIKLPGIDGFEVTRRIRIMNGEIPIIAQTAHAFTKERDIAKAVGCNEIITKPITQASVDEVLSKYMPIHVS
jgi:signal transduction histidine kinase/CheY-like chemotaxis protein